MAMIDYTCPVCNKVVLSASGMDDNNIDILFNHLTSWHKDKLISKDND